MNIQGTQDNQDAEPGRYVRYQFWLSDHDQGRILFSEWSDAVIDEADVMLPDQIVDLQHWDAHSGTIWNHLIDAGWQPATMPYGVDPDLPIPEVLPDHETIQAPAEKAIPVHTQAAKPAQAPTYAPQGPP